jgi:centromere protein S
MALIVKITNFFLKKDFQRLKAALELSVRDILAEVGAETGCNFTAESSATISELVLEKSVRSASDLQAFAAHAKRQSVTAEDVRLLTRRNPELNARLTALTKDQGESSGQKKTVVKPRRGGKGGQDGGSGLEREASVGRPAPLID